MRAWVGLAALSLLLLVGCGNPAVPVDAGSDDPTAVQEPLDRLGWNNDCRVLWAELAAALGIDTPQKLLNGSDSDTFLAYFEYFPRILIALAVPVLCTGLMDHVHAAEPACGAAIRRADGTYWRCTFADEFSGSELDTGKWSLYTTEASGQHGNGDCWTDSPNNVSVSDGSLRITTRREEAPFTCTMKGGSTYQTQYSSGGVSTWNKFDQAYGRFAFRAKFPEGKYPGIHTALWLYPTKELFGDWPASGEIDVAEYYSNYADRAVPFIHYLTSLTDSVTNTRCMVSDPSDYHTYVAEWTRTKIVISIDDTVCVDHTISPLLPLLGPQPFDQPFAVHINQGLGRPGNIIDPTSPLLPATTQIDWVHIWTAPAPAPDTVKPTVSLKSPVPWAQLGTTVAVKWTASDGTGSGIKSLTLARKRSPFNGNFGLVTYTPMAAGVTSRTASLAAGSTDCFAIRATDKANNVGVFSPWRCTTRPLDDRALSRSAGWSLGRSSAYLNSTLTGTSSAGRTLSRPGARVRRIGLVATKCARCGSVVVKVGSTVIGSVNLFSARTKYKQLISLPVTSLRTGTVSITTRSSGKPVFIDGLALSRQ